MKFEVDNLVKLCVFLCGKGVGLKVGQLGGVFKKSKELFGEHNNYENMFKVVKTLKNGEGGGDKFGDRRGQISKRFAAGGGTD